MWTDTSGPRAAAMNRWTCDDSWYPHDNFETTLERYRDGKLLEGPRAHMWTWTYSIRQVVV